MHIPTLIRRLTLPVGALLVVTACASGQSAGWTYAPLGPTAAPSAAATGAPSSAPGSPSGSGGTGSTIDIKTPADQQLAFVPAEITVTAGSQVTINYLNDSPLMHNINFFNGPDNSAPSLGATEPKTGPGDAQSLSFTAPTQPGDYFFWCDVHGNAMKGIWHVQ
jgi:plastocyanin